MNLEEILTASKGNDIHSVLQERLAELDMILNDEILLEALGGFTEEDMDFVRKAKLAYKFNNARVFVDEENPHRKWSKADAEDVKNTVKSYYHWRAHPILKLLKEAIIAVLVVGFLAAMVALGVGLWAHSFALGIEMIMKSNTFYGVILSQLVTLGISLSGSAVIAGAGAAFDTYKTGRLERLKSAFKDFRSFIAETIGRTRLVQIVTKVISAGVGVVKGVVSSIKSRVTPNKFKDFPGVSFDQDPERTT